MFKFICFFSCFVGCCLAASIITPCKLDDKACILTSAQAVVPKLGAGLPELGIPPADPLILDDVKTDDGQLQLQFRNLKVHGTGKCKIQSIDVAIEKHFLKFSMECPITATGQYSVAGKLMVVPIEGAGDFEIKTDKIRLDVNAQLDTIKGADGKSHWDILSVTYEYEPLAPVLYRLDNLFGGDEVKAKPVVDLLNLSGDAVLKTIGKPVITEIVHKAKDLINDFFHVVPTEETYLA